jgi:hypothetical protein
MNHDNRDFAYKTESHTFGEGLRYIRYGDLMIPLVRSMRHLLVEFAGHFVIEG